MSCNRHDLETRREEQLELELQSKESAISSEVPCKDHPLAPHGFLRQASHNEGRYVCECEFWEEQWGGGR